MRGRLTSLIGLVGQRFLPRGHLVATALISLVGQCVLPRGRLTLLVGLVGQRFLLHGRLVATAPVEIGGIKLGYLCGGERRGKMCRRWSTVPHFGGGLELGQRRYHQRCSVFGHPTLLVGLVGQCILPRGRLMLLVGLVGQRFLLQGLNAPRLMKLKL